MSYEEKQQPSAKTHSISMENRTKLNVTGVEDVGAGTVGVVGSDIALVDGHGQRLGSARLDHAGLAEADQRNGRLLDAVFLVVVGVGALDINLHGLFAGHVAGVGDLDGDGVGVIGGIVADVHVADVEVGVAHAVAEGVSHDVAVGVVACVAVAGDAGVAGTEPDKPGERDGKAGS